MCTKIIAIKSDGPSIEATGWDPASISRPEMRKGLAGRMKGLDRDLGTKVNRVLVARGRVVGHKQL